MARCGSSSYFAARQTSSRSALPWPMHEQLAERGDVLRPKYARGGDRGALRRARIAPALLQAMQGGAGALTPGGIRAGQRPWDLTAVEHAVGSSTTLTRMACRTSGLVIGVTDHDQDAELERLLALGAKTADMGQAGTESQHVLAHPKGTEFCLLHTLLQSL